MMSIKADGGRPMAIKPTVLVVPPTLRANAIEIVKNERLANGASNPNFGVVDLIVSPWLI
jgi:phage major head subunit gpT-like protein